MPAHFAHLTAQQGEPFFPEKVLCCVGVCYEFACLGIQVNRATHGAFRPDDPDRQLLCDSQLRVFHGLADGGLLHLAESLVGGAQEFAVEPGLLRAVLDALHLVQVELHAHDRQLQHVLLLQHDQRGVFLGKRQPTGEHEEENDDEPEKVPGAVAAARGAVLQPCAACGAPEDDGRGCGDEGERGRADEFRPLHQGKPVIERHTHAVPAETQGAVGSQPFNADPHGAAAYGAAQGAAQICGEPLAPGLLLLLRAGQGCGVRDAGQARAQQGVCHACPEPHQA